MNSSEQTRFVLFRELMFPNPQHAPSRATQSPRHQNVALFIFGKLLSPERLIVFWFCLMLRAAMPETAVDKKREPGLPENEIQFAEDFLIPPPASDFVPAK